MNLGNKMSVLYIKWLHVDIPGICLRLNSLKSPARERLARGPRTAPAAAEMARSAARRPTPWLPGGSRLRPGRGGSLPVAVLTILDGLL